MTAIGWLIMLCLIGFIALTGIRLVPIYMDHFSVMSSMRSLSKEDLGGMDRAKVRELLIRRLEINSVTDVGREHIEVEQRGRRTAVTVAYEVRKPLLGNIDIVVSFDNRVEAYGN